MDAIECLALERESRLVSEVEDPPGAGVEIDRADEQQPVLGCSVGSPPVTSRNQVP